MNIKHILLVVCLQVPGFSVVVADQAEDMAAMQKQLNAEVLAKPFHAAQPEKVDAYIKDAMKKNIKPPEYKGNNWKQGYTCNDMLRYSWTEYRNCSYYRSYYGRYYH